MKFRLKSAHYINDVWLPGDKENEHIGDGVEKGTIVGDGTAYSVTSPTIEMVALDEEGEEALEREVERLQRNQSSMNPMEQLARTMGQALGGDTFEERYVPGFNVKRDGLGGAKK